VKALYFWLLHRPSDPTGLQDFTGAIQNGNPVEAVVAAIIGSAEYLANRV
jgi:hypothetical protein